MDKKAKNIATAIVLIGFPIITTILALMISNLEKQTSRETSHKIFLEPTGWHDQAGHPAHERQRPAGHGLLSK